MLLRVVAEVSSSREAKSLRQHVHLSSSGTQKLGLCGRHAEGKLYCLAELSH